MNIEKMLAECRAHCEKTKPDAVFADYWIGWQASRESLVIELPQQSGANPSWNQAIRYCHQAIEAAGLKVKP